MKRYHCPLKQTGSHKSYISLMKHGDIAVGAKCKYLMTDYLKVISLKDI